MVPARSDDQDRGRDESGDAHGEKGRSEDPRDLAAVVAIDEIIASERATCGAHHAGRCEDEGIFDAERGGNSKPKLSADESEADGALRERRVSLGYCGRLGACSHHRGCGDEEKCERNEEQRAKRQERLGGCGALRVHEPSI